VIGLELARSSLLILKLIAILFVLLSALLGLFGVMKNL